MLSVFLRYLTLPMAAEAKPGSDLHSIVSKPALLAQLPGVRSPHRSTVRHRPLPGRRRNSPVPPSVAPGSPCQRDTNRPSDNANLLIRFRMEKHRKTVGVSSVRYGWCALGICSSHLLEQSPAVPIDLPKTEEEKMKRCSPVMLLSAALVLSAADAIAGDSPESGLMLPTDRIEWTDNPRVPGLGLAKVLGDETVKVFGPPVRAG